MTERLQIHRDAEDVVMDYAKKKLEESVHYLNLERCLGKEGEELKATSSYKEYMEWLAFILGPDSVD